MDTTRFLHTLTLTARANLAHVPGSERTAEVRRECARAALQEAHSTLSQRHFFAMLDALGGHQAVLEQVERALADEPGA